LVEYQPTWDAMKRFTAERTSDTRDEIWLVQHPPTYTQGLAGKPEHLLHSTGIPVIKSIAAGKSPIMAPARYWPTCCLICAAGKSASENWCA